MKPLLSILSLALALVTCDGSQDIEVSQAPGNTNDESLCDEAHFVTEREKCDSTFKLNIPHNHGEMHFVCLVISKYKTCLADSIRATNCGNKEFLLKQLQPMQLYIQQNKIECVRPVNASFRSGTPTEYRAKLDLCTRDKAWETQFMCAKKFHAKLRKIEDDKEVESHQICRSLSRYYSCLNTVLHSESCEEDTELMTHMEYFPKVLTQKYREMCVAELKLTAMNVAKRLRGYTADTTCREEDATREFFACGIVFNEITSHSPRKDRLCMAFKNFENCTNNVNAEMGCSISSEFRGHSMHVLNVLLSGYDSYCRSYTGVPPVPGIDKTDAPYPKTKMCDQMIYMEHYFFCGLSYIFNVRDVMFGDHTDMNNGKCRVTNEYDACLAKLKMTSECKDDLPIEMHLKALSNTLKKETGAKCNKQGRSGKIRFRSQEPSCHVREYANNYFTCGYIFLKNTIKTTPQSVDEDCRLFKNFMRCKDLLIACKGDSDISSALNVFTNVLIEGYESKCKDYNISETCVPMILIKNFFACGLRFHQSYNEFSPTYLGGQPFLCRLIEDFENCTKFNVLDNDCKTLGELFTHIKKVREFVGKLTNEAKNSACTISSDRQRRIYLGLERQTSCNQFKAVKKLVLCGVTFHRMLLIAENSTTITDNQTTICPLVKEMKYCMYSSTHDSGCSDALFLNTEVSVLKKHLLREFEDMCNTVPQSEEKEFKVYRQACELKEFTQEWETCDSAMEEDIGSFYRNTTGHTRATGMSDPVRKRLCRDLRGYRNCLNESADRHHCSGLAPQVADMSNELFDKMGLIYCSGCSPGISRFHWGPVFLASATRLFTHLAENRN